MNYVVLDLEATCWEKRDKQPTETIEIGAVLINKNKEIESEFQQFIKPLIHPHLSDFCTELTSIQQKEVDSAPYFPNAIEQFKEWFGLGNTDYILCSWGFYDKKQFESDCKIHDISTDWLEQHISLKHQYAKIMNLRRAIGMKNALINEKMELTGTHHRGIDDARNIAKIFVKHFDKWQF